MNTLLLKYAVEVEKTGSISKAAENLYMNQPRLSKAIRELEELFGISIFNRTSKGVITTKKGKEFLSYAKNILAQIDEMELLYKADNETQLKFEISVPRASYISRAFTVFLKDLDTNDKTKVDYRETNSLRTIDSVVHSESNLGIIRYQTMYEKHFSNLLEEKDLKFEQIYEFESLLLMSKMHPLANENVIRPSQLGEYTEIMYGDLTIPFLSPSQAKQLKKIDEKNKKIKIYDRGSQFELLSRIPTTYMWVSPTPKEVLSLFSLTQKSCDAANNKHKDMLIYRKGYMLSKTDKMFMEKLFKEISEVSKL